MKVSIKWLRDYIDFDLSVDELVYKLTMAGLEVDSVEKLDTGLDKVVVGKILNIKQHPNADKLVLCDVDAGDETLKVVCGAPNTKEGMVAPLALVGAALPSGMEIRAAKVRGESSYGMLCSEKELGFSEDAAGLMELSSELKSGTPLAEALGLDDTVLDIDLTPNRPDCLSIFGVAREVSAATGNPLRQPQITMTEGDTKASNLTSVTILDPDLCPRYAARIIRGVEVASSPAWMQQRLEAVGLRGINNVVDVTNYVLMELGHPLHAFDYNLLAENRIVVRRAREGEEIVSIDEETRKLTDDMLVIADAEKPVAVAGVMGGFHSEVTETTTDVLLESAYFNPVSIRKTSKALGMHTEASHRFERGMDIEGLITAIDRTAQLIQELAGGEICKDIVDAYPIKPEPTKIRLRPERVNYVLGTDIPVDKMKGILTDLEFEVSGDGEVTVPTFRPDATREIDLIEEIARIYGYDNIPFALPTGDIPLADMNPKAVLRDKAKSAMLDCGLTEAINYSFYSPKVFDLINLPEDSAYRKVMSLKNPLSEEQSIMRTTLIPSLLENVRWNVNRQVADVKLFELSSTYIPKGEGELPHERELIAGAISGSMGLGTWADPKREADFFDIKGIVEVLLEELGILKYEVKLTENSTLHPVRNAELLVKGESIGTLGEVHPDVLDNYDIQQRVYIFELDFDKLTELADTKRAFKQISQYPSVSRDIAIVVSDDIASGETAHIIQTTGGELIASIKLFDVYTGKPIPEGKKSLAYAIEFQADRTLTDEEVDKIQLKIVSRLEKEIGAELRS